MLGYRERERLMRDYRHESARGIGLVLKCAACLVILVGIALIGTWDEPPEGFTPAAIVDSKDTLQRPRSASVEAQSLEPRLVR
jgi:hypothetical protein